MLGGGRQPVAAHDRADLLRIRRTAVARNGVAYLAEVLGTEHSRARYAKAPGIRTAVVLEAVDLAPSDAHRVTRADVDRPPLDGERQRALEPVDRLLERIVAVRRGDLGRGRDLHLEHGHAPTRVGALDQEADPQRTHRDDLSGTCLHAPHRSSSLVLAC